jgi:hypothetical protein
MTIQKDTGDGEAVVETLTTPSSAGTATHDSDWEGETMLNSEVFATVAGSAMQ